MVLTGINNSLVGRPRVSPRVSPKAWLAGSPRTLLGGWVHHQHQPLVKTRSAAGLENAGGASFSFSRRDLLLRLGMLGLAVAADLAGAVAGPRAAHANTSSLRPLTPDEQAAVDKALKAVVTKQKAPVALRLVFHDAGTYSGAAGNGGVNASVRFELDRPENFGLKRGWRLIEQLQASLKGTPAAGLSFADLIALAGAQAVAVCGGPRIPLRVGRADASGPDPEGRMLSEQASAAQQKASFADKGFSPKELVALLGAHTIGNKGYGDPYTFDSVYYQELLKKPWLNTNDSMASMIGIPSDHVLPDDPELVPYIQEYAQSQAAFHRDFTAAYIKMSELGV